MCGINGLFAYNRAAHAPDPAELRVTRDHMAPRGPDGAGDWWGAEGRVGFGHRRLAIVDLSERGHQPMASGDGRHVVTFNGEIYNYRALRAELEAEGVAFRSDSDTEILLHLYAREGAGMVRRLRGMFAFALWDGDRGGLLLARDPYGIKPLYVADDGWTFRFASSVKALIAGGRVDPAPDPAGVVGFAVFGSVPDPFTVHRAVRALPAGHTQWVDRAGPREAAPYHDVAEVLAAGAEAPLPAARHGERVREAVLESVEAHLLADVEVGVFLSAGVDSGALLGLMKEGGVARPRAITLTFAEYAGTAEDEGPLAAEVARTYGADHRARAVSRDEFVRELPAILAAMDQPSIDGVNTYFVAKAAREAGLKVALSGVGADELLAGYPSFREVPRAVAALRAFRALPGLGRAVRGLTGGLGVLKDRPKYRGLLEHGGTLEGAYLLRRALFLPFELEEVLAPDFVERGLERFDPLAHLRALSTPRPRSATAAVALLESAQYMRHQLLRDADWAGMAHSVEIRTPFVDSALLAAMAPVTAALGPAGGKALLARAPATPLPAAVAGRSKTGFTVPTGAWMREVMGGADDGMTRTKGLASRLFAGAVLSRFVPEAVRGPAAPPADPVEAPERLAA